MRFFMVDGTRHDQKCKEQPANLVRSEVFVLVALVCIEIFVALGIIMKPKYRYVCSEN